MSSFYCTLEANPSKSEMKPYTHCDPSIDFASDDEYSTACGDLECYYLGNESRNQRSYLCSQAMASSLPQLRCALNKNKNNRVRFSAVLVTSVETRPRTLSEDKPNLYWTANEIAELRNQQYVGEMMENADDMPSKGAFHEEQGAEHETFFRSRHLEVGCCNHLGDSRGNTRQRSADLFYEADSAPANIIPLDEEHGPHLLGSSLECDWVQ